MAAPFVALVDYGAGNLRSVAKALEAAGARVEVTAEAARLEAAEKVVLPGVGAFGDGMAGLEARGLVAPLRRLAASGPPLLGICLGMQLLFEESEESAAHRGLALLPGLARRLPGGRGLKVPHTGWNQIHPRGGGPLLAGLPEGAYAYFNHGYYCDAAAAGDVAATTDHGIPFPCAVARGHLYGVQFHPEKSQAVGLALLRNFLERCR